jgi:uncharacterized protein (TIGR00730 family)
MRIPTPDPDGGGDEAVPRPGPRKEKMTDRELSAWRRSRVKDLWRIFRIMSEFVEGFETFSELGPCVSVIGSARTDPGHEYYEMAQALGRELVERDFGVITGGGPGIMEAANKGAQEADGVSVGLGITVPHEKGANAFVDHDKLITFDFFFVRKVMFVKYAQGFVAFPGGFGTMDELFESLTLIQTGKSTRFPIVLMGEDFWDGMIGWLRETMLEADNITEDDCDLFQVTDDPGEAVEMLESFYEEHPISPNF